MMRKILVMSIVLLLTLSLKAQQDKKAKSILDQVSEKARSFKSISADFAFTMKNVEMEIDEKNDGKIKLKGQKYNVELPDIGIQVFSDGKTIWNYMEEGNQVTINNIDEEGSELMDPSALFSIYEKGFDSKFIAEEKAAGKTVYNIELYPNNEEQDVSKIILLIDKTSMMIHAATLYSNDGNLYGIEVKKMETNHDFPDSDFVFDPSAYNDLEIIDFR